MYFVKSWCYNRLGGDGIISYDVCCICVISVPIFIFRYNKAKCKIWCQSDTGRKSGTIHVNRGTEGREQ